jgi:isoquinoline 1-oxidoreductase beta subunit
VDRSQVEAKLGVLTAGNRTGTYGEFAEAAAKVKLDKEPEIKKDPATWWLLGKGQQRLDIPHKVNGSAQYAIDTRLPGMVYAAVKASPVPWGTLKSYNFDAIKNRPGVIAAVQLKAVPGKRNQPDMQDAVAVVADSYYRAKTALELLPVEWSSATAQDQHRGLLRRRPQADRGEGSRQRQGRPEGRRDHRGLQESGDRVISAPFETHARMEPTTPPCTCRPIRVDVWSPAARQSAAVLLVADQLRSTRRRLRPHHVPGRRFPAAMAAAAPRSPARRPRSPKQVGKPVKVIWPREEDLAQDKQRPLTVAKLTAAIGDDGLPTAIFHPCGVGHL